MPSPSHRPDSFRANRPFTDRDEARQLFAEQCAKPQGANDYRVLNYSGIGGMGKSALCGQFELHLRQQQEKSKNLLAWATVNFEVADKRQATQALLALRLQLADNGKLSFPAFDTAFARHFALTQAGRNLTNVHPELFRQSNDILRGLASFTEGVSGVPFVGALVEGGNFFDNKLFMRNWSKRRGDVLMRGLYALAPHELEAELPKYLGADIDDWLQDKDAPGRRLVLLYDTYEALWRDRADKSDALADKWLQQFVGETPAVLHVVLGRDPLSWAQQYPEEWQTIITPFPLENLSDDDAEKFLQAVPIAEADIRQKIVSGAKGIPFYLELQVDQYEQNQRDGKAPLAANFGGAEPDMLARFTNHLPDQLRRALVVAACARWLDETLFLQLCEKFMGGVAAVCFADLTRYSFWSENAGRFYLHAVMRDYLQAHSREHEPALFGQVHQFLFEHYDRKLQAIQTACDIAVEQSEALVEAAYHLVQIERAKLPIWAKKYNQTFYTAALWAVLEPLLQQVMDVCQQIGDKSSEGATLNNISRIYDARGDYTTSLGYLEKSLTICKQIGDKAGEGAALNNIALIYDARGDYATALDYLQQSLTILQEIGDTYGEGATLNNISLIYMARGNFPTALDYLEKSLTIQQEIGNKSGEGATLNNISQIFQARGDYATALDYLQQSLTIRQEIGDKSGEGTTLNNISLIYNARGDYATALDYLQQSLTIRQEIGDKSGEGTTLNNISQIYKARCDYATALDYLQQSLTIQQEIGDKSGEGKTLNNMATIAHERGDYATALDYLQQSLTIQQQIGDEVGMCATLFNMGHFHEQNGEPERAVHLWLKVYAVAREINLARELVALEKLAGQLGLPGGLAGWAALAKKMESRALNKPKTVRKKSKRKRR